MNVILEKDGQTLEYKAGAALYLLLNFVPLVGFIITLVMMIMKKQFKGIFLNQLVVGLILTLLLFVSFFTGSDLLISIVYFIVLGFSAFMTVMYIINANYYSIKQRLEDGYTVTNENELEVQEAVTRAQSIKKPFWQLIKF